MYLDPLVYYALWAYAATLAALCLVAGATIARGRTVGGLTFCRLGRLGFSFYVRR